MFRYQGGLVVPSGFLAFGMQRHRNYQITLRQEHGLEDKFSAKFSGLLFLELESMDNFWCFRHIPQLNAAGQELHFPEISSPAKEEMPAL